MGITFAVCYRSLSGMGREMDQTYANVVARVQSTSGDLSSISNHPVWSDPAGNEFTVVLTSEQYDQFQSQINHDRMPCQPLWQVRSSANAQASPSFGSFADPTDAASAFSEGVSLPDTRHALRFYDGDPDSGGVILDPTQTYEASQTPLLVYIKFYDKDDTPLTFTQDDLLLDLGGSQLMVDVVSGKASFNVNIEKTSTIVLAGDHGYRVVTSGGSWSVSWRVFSRSLG